MKKPNFYLCINVLIVPVLFILLSSFSKKISRRSGGFQRQDFFLGSDLVLAATSVGLASITENGADRNAVFMFMLVCIFALFNVISFHQEKQTGDRKTELFWLVGFCNLIGMIPMIGYLLFLKI